MCCSVCCCSGWCYNAEVLLFWFEMVHLQCAAVDSAVCVAVCGAVLVECVLQCVLQWMGQPVLHWVVRCVLLCF